MERPEDLEGAVVFERVAEDLVGDRNSAIAGVVVLAVGAYIECYFQEVVGELYCPVDANYMVSVLHSLDYMGLSCLHPVVVL
jgi:hypothetical protein